MGREENAKTQKMVGARETKILGNRFLEKVLKDRNCNSLFT